MRTLLLLLLSLSIYAETTPFQKQNYLNLTPQFSEWDSLSVHEVLVNHRFCEITYADSLFYLYSPLFSEWDMLLTPDEMIASWDGFHGFEHFVGWDSLSLFNHEYQALCFNRWLSYASHDRKPFEIEFVPHWDPRTSLADIPFGTDVTASAAHNPNFTGRVEPLVNLDVQFFSNRLALTPYKELLQLNDPDILSDFITVTIKNTFNILNSDTPDEISDKMKRKLERDISIYSHISYRPLRISGDVGNMELRVYNDLAFTIPGDLFGVIFAGNLTEGSVVDVSPLSMKTVTAVALSGGGRSVRDVPDFMSKLLPSGGGTFKKVVNVDLITGLAMGEMNGKSGELTVEDNGTSFSFHGEAEVLLAGTGLQDKYDFVLPFKNGFSPAGYGASVDFGMEIADDRRAIALYLNNMGAMRWNDVQSGTLEYHIDSLDVESMANSQDGEVFHEPDLDSLKNIGSIWRPVNTQMTAGIVQVLHRRDRESVHSGYSRQLRAYGEYQQGFTSYPGNSFIPRITAGIENDFLWGGISAGYFFVAGGAQRIGSGATFKLLNGTWFTLSMKYNAYGSPILFPKRGFGASVVTQFFRRKDRWFR